MLVEAEDLIFDVVLSQRRMVEPANASQAFTYQDIVAATGNF
jgi:hypothetical protein